MANTLGIHWAHTTHGSWLHGDWRGSWRNGKLIGPDPFLEEAMRMQMSDDAVMLSDVERILVAIAFGEVVRERNLVAYAATIRCNHVHVVFGPVGEPLKEVLASLKRRSAGSVCDLRRQMKRETPRHIWTGGRFPVFIFDESHLLNPIEYVRRHNTRAGLPPDPYDWITPLYPPRKAADRHGRPI